MALTTVKHFQYDMCLGIIGKVYMYVGVGITEYVTIFWEY